MNECHSLSDAVWDLHVLSGDELRKLLKTVDELQLPAELRAEEEEEVETKKWC